MPVSALTFSTSACTLCKNSGTSDAWYFFPALILVWWSYQHWWVTLFFKHGVQPYLSTLSDIIGSLISLSNGSEDRSKKRRDYLADRTVNPKNTTRDTPSLHHQRICHMCLDIHQGVEIPLRFVRTIHQGVLIILWFLSGLHQGYPKNFCQICPDYHQGSSPIFRGPV